MHLLAVAKGVAVGVGVPGLVGVESRWMVSAIGMTETPGMAAASASAWTTSRPSHNPSTSVSGLSGEVSPASSTPSRSASSPGSSSPSPSESPRPDRSPSRVLRGRPARRRHRYRKPGIAVSSVPRRDHPDHRCRCPAPADPYCRTSPRGSCRDRRGRSRPFWGSLSPGPPPRWRTHVLERVRERVAVGVHEVDVWRPPQYRAASSRSSRSTMPSRFRS